MSRTSAPTAAATELAETFSTRWHASGGAERANYQLFLSELCGILNVPHPNPTRPDDADNVYVFERTVRFDHGDGSHSTGRIDLYKRGCFVLETKQGVAAAIEADAPALFAAPKSSRKGHGVRGTAAWDAAMANARGQAEQYVRALPAAEGNPPFLLVVDVGHSIELYADFSRLGKTYTPFPDSRTYRIALADLRDEAIRKRLAAVWTDPLSLDPSRHSAKVTRKVAEKLATLARSLEASGHHAEVVAHFLMRCLFTFFAEDARLIDRERDEEQPFTQLLRSLKDHPDQFVPMVQDVWSRMNAGGFSPALRRKLKHFNGEFFKDSTALPLNPQQLDLLIDAGNSDWSDVEPAIFGTLLERALDSRERHKLGAHYTPRAYVERLVLPTVIEPLREQFDAAKAAAFTLNFQGKPEDARKAVRDFLARLCSTTVLDPACGSGNFLYVTMEHMKRLEGEARGLLKDLGETQELLERAGLTVDPHQFLGLELNPRAVAIAELVLWIGYLKWHLRTLGHAPNEPLLKDFHNIVQQDAVLAYDAKELVKDEQGKPVTRWDGHTTKTSPVTGEEIPDESARVPVYRYINARKAEWPKADYVVGNPPYIGVRRIISALGEDYVTTLRQIYDDVPESCDYVMFWWHRAADATSKGAIHRFGFITTNSIVQHYSRGLLERHLLDKAGIALAFAIPDHPWVEAADGAAVQVAMTVGVAKKDFKAPATLGRVALNAEHPEQSIVEKRPVSTINATLKSGEHLELEALQSNEALCFQGVVPAGDGFKLTADELIAFGLTPARLPDVVRPYIIGRDLVQEPDQKFIIDFFGISENEARSKWPSLMQRLVDRVYPERRQNRRAAYRDKWWIFAEPRPAMRKALAHLKRFIVTPYTAKHRPFVFVQESTLPDAMAYAVPSDDAYVLGVLSSRAHRVWALSTGGTLEDRPRYNSKATFAPFPFPACSDAQKQKIRELGEALDAHRKRQQAAHPGLTITDMYNVLEKLRRGEELSAKDKKVHEQGLVSVLKQIHDDLDDAVAQAYGWPGDLTDEQILQKLVALNHERAEEERRGVIRWLRPEFQNPSGRQATQQGELAIGTKQGAAAAAGAATMTPGKGAKKPPFPKTLAEQAASLRAALAARPTPASAEELARGFARANLTRVRELLDALRLLGQVRQVDADRFAA